MKYVSDMPNFGRFKAHKTWVSMSKAAKMLGVSFPTMKRYVDRGWVKGIRKGVHMSIELSEIERFQREGNGLTPLEKAARDEQEAPRPQKLPDPERIIPGHPPDEEPRVVPYVHPKPAPPASTVPAAPKEAEPQKQSAFPPYLRNIPKKG